MKLGVAERQSGNGVKNVFSLIRLLWFIVKIIPLFAFWSITTVLLFNCLFLIIFFFIDLSNILWDPMCMNEGIEIAYFHFREYLHLFRQGFTMLFTHYYLRREPIVIDRVFNEAESLVCEIQEECFCTYETKIQYLEFVLTRILSSLA